MHPQTDEFSSMTHTCIFTITTGRSGTAFLAQLLRANLSDAEVNHEILRYDAFGVDTPDLSDMVQFNAFGNTNKVRAFWKRKLSRIATKPKGVYAETSHLLAKAGLLENIAPLADGRTIYIVLLRRDVVKVLSSLQSRYDFLNKGNMWLWYLDPDYPRKIVDTAPFKKRGWSGICLWYVCEMLTRAEYYRLLFSDVPGIHFIEAEIDQLNDPDHAAEFLGQLGQRLPAGEITIPPPQNRGRLKKHSAGSIEAIRRVVKGIAFDPEGLAKQYVHSGRRLADSVGPKG